jgi:hypothetical protein
MGDVSSKLMAQFADNLNHMIDEEGLGAPTAAPAAPTTPEASDPAGTPGDTSAGESATPPKPQVRKIEGPATEPIDLMEVGGSSIVKRIAPAVLALIVLLLVLRRRRR